MREPTYFVFVWSIVELDFYYDIIIEMSNITPRPEREDELDGNINIGVTFSDQI